MKYYEVCLLAKDSRIFGGIATYSSEVELPAGSLVKVDYRNRKSAGYIAKEVQKPQFKTKPISSLLDEKPLTKDLQQTARWMSTYYAADLPTIVRTILPAGVQKSRRTKPKQQHKQDRAQNFSIALSAEQKNVSKDAWTSVKPSLLYGVTGAGKTHVYLDLIEKAAAKNTDTILLIPEIALSNQLVEKVSKFFKNVHHIHSGLTESERHQTWKKISNAHQPVIVIGPRSALFSPVQKLGLIIIDECHDQSFKQDTKPSYNALHVAATRAKLADARLVMGSATPNISEAFLAREGRLNFIELPERIHSQDKHEKAIVDLRDKTKFRLNKFLSDPLINSIEQSIASKKQSLLFINRRGYAPSINCVSCSWRATCPECESFLALHEPHTLRCHICGWKDNSIINSCPECHNPTVHYNGVGTQKLVQILKKQFPSANIVRMDQDNKDANDSETLNGDFDILVGTQMISKGFDLSKLETVGVVNADGMMFLPDFRANERAFQIINQVIGRNDRRGSGGRTFIQTSAPNEKTISQAMNDKYWEFYKEELAHRKQFNYPPYSYLAKITAKRKTDDAASGTLQELKESLLRLNPSLIILGPTPSFHHPPRMRAWSMVIKSKSRKNFATFGQLAEQNDLIVNLDPLDLL